MSDRNEFRKIIRKLLLEETPPEGIKSSFKDENGKIWNFESQVGTTNRFTYTSGNDTAVFPFSVVSSSARASTAARETSASSDSAKKGVAVTPKKGYKKLNKVIRDIWKGLNYPALFQRDYKLPTDKIVKNVSEVPSIEETDDLSVSTVAYLYLVSGQIQDKIKEKQKSNIDKFTSALLSFVHVQTERKTLANVYDENAWKTMRESIVDASPTNVDVAAKTYMTSLPALAVAGIDPNTVDGFADYLAILAKAVDILSNDYGATSEPAAATAASGAQGAPATQPETLVDFLSYPQIFEITKFSAEQLKGGFGPTAGEALKNLKIALIEKDSVTFAQVKDEINSLINEGLKSLPDDAKKIDDVTASWSPPKGGRLSFDPGETGIVDFLRAAYIIKRDPDADPTGATAASAVKVETTLKDRVFPDSNLWKALGLIGSLSPMPVFAFQSPGSVPAGTTLTLKIGGAEYPAKRASASEEGKVLLYTIGRVADLSMKYGSYTVSTNFFEQAGYNIAEAVRGGSAIEFTISYNDKTWTKSQVVKIGDIVTVNESNRVIGQQEQAQRLSGEDIAKRQESTKLGATVSGKTRLGAFQLQNVYIDNVGKVLLRRPNVMLEKRVLGAGDKFILTSQVGAQDYILIPIPVSRASSTMSSDEPMSSHWTSVMLGGKISTPGKANGVAVKYLPVVMLSWGYDDNYLDFGSNGVDKIIPSMVEYVEAPPGYVKEKGIDVLTEQEALSQGVSGEADPITTAIISYVQSNNNPTGTALYLSSNLNARMNGFDKLVRQTF